MKVIPLTMGQFAKVDDHNYEKVFNFGNGKWYAIKKKRSYYAATLVNGSHFYMHWLIMGTQNVDHIDHDGLNNLESNLRLANECENNQHRRKMRHNTSGYKGVSWCQATGSWQVQIMANKKARFIGRFANKVQAAKAYNEAAVRLHGQFAVLNEIVEGTETLDESLSGIGTN